MLKRYLRNPLMKDTIDKFAALADEGERKIQELEKSTQF